MESRCIFRLNLQAHVIKKTTKIEDMRKVSDRNISHMFCYLYDSWARFIYSLCNCFLFLFSRKNLWKMVFDSDHIIIMIFHRREKFGLTNIFLFIAKWHVCGADNNIRGKPQWFRQSCVRFCAEYLLWFKITEAKYRLSFGCIRLLTWKPTFFMMTQLHTQQQKMPTKRQLQAEIPCTHTKWVFRASCWFTIVDCSEVCIFYRFRVISLSLSLSPFPYLCVFLSRRGIARQYCCMSWQHLFFIIMYSSSSYHITWMTLFFTVHISSHIACMYLSEFGHYYIFIRVVLPTLISSEMRNA